MFADVVAVVGAIADGASDVAALNAATVLGAVTEVGATLNVVGDVTGSASLQKVGGMMALAGGVGSLVDGGFNALTDAAPSNVDPFSGSSTNSAVDTLQGATPVGTNPMAAPATQNPTDAISSSVDPSPTATPQSIGLPQNPIQPGFNQIGADSNINPMNGQVNGNNPIGATTTTPSGAPNQVGSPQTIPANQSINEAYGNTTNFAGDNSDPNAIHNPSDWQTPDTPNFLQKALAGYSPQAQAALIQGGMGALGGLSKAYSSQKQLDLEKQQFGLQQLQYQNLNAQPIYSQPGASTSAPNPVIGTGLLQQTNKSNV